MKRLITLMAVVCMAMTSVAQDSTSAKPDNDTLRVGNIIIVRTARTDPAAIMILPKGASSIRMKISPPTG